MCRYLVDPINDHRAGVDMAHCYCGVPCLSGTHIYGRNQKMVFQEGHTETDQKAKLDRLLGYMRRICDVRIEGSTKFNALEATVSVGKRKATKPTFRLTLRRLLGKLFP